MLFHVQGQKDFIAVTEELSNFRFGRKSVIILFSASVSTEKAGKNLVLLPFPNSKNKMKVRIHLDTHKITA